MPSQMKNIYFAPGIYGINTFFNEKSRLLLPWERWLSENKNIMKKIANLYGSSGYFAKCLTNNNWNLSH